ncbi:MAG: hypothetical protein E6Q77_01925 [Rhizobium sp.]|nr:MAG: hypothetical protein E6Q77_01925 [Rhizobium sp.]
MSGPFAAWAPTYQNLGYWPRPVKPGTKSPPMRGWQLPDVEQGKSAISQWIRKFGEFGIGLVMGSPVGDGTSLGALDVDRDEYHELARNRRVWLARLSRRRSARLVPTILGKPYHSQLFDPRPASLKY